MTSPHPAAVDSYGPRAVRWLWREHGLRLRWWQELALARILEHDAMGELVWVEVLISTARQVGKSVLMRAYALWRIHEGPELFGEDQLIVHTGKDLHICREVMMGARRWANEVGDIVREQNGGEEISTKDKSGRWLVRGRNSVYGYSATAGMVDEAWGVTPAIVEEGLEPTLADHRNGQLLMLSTAHRRSTGLYPGRRAAALAAMNQPPTTTLVLEWSASADTEIDERPAWREASPHWSPGRERLLESRVLRAEQGTSDDPDEDDPVESFRSQYLNIWPAKRLVNNAKDSPLVAELDWIRAIDLTAEPPPHNLVAACEDFYGIGAAAAASGMLADGRILVWGDTFSTKAEALAWVTYLCESYKGTRFIVGASFINDEAVQKVPAASITGGTAVLTRSALPSFRELVSLGRLAHGGNRALTEQVTRCRVVERESGLAVSSRASRTDLVRCAAWAANELLRATDTPLPFFAF